MNAKELFKKFLKEKGVYDLYCQNFDKNYEGGTNVRKNGNKIKGIYFFVVLAFLWGNTPEGDSFWKKIDDEWIEYINKHWIF